MTEKEKYLNSIKVKQGLGLKNIGFYVADPFGMTEEEVYAELNRMDAAPDLPDREVLGKYSI